MYGSYTLAVFLQCFQCVLFYETRDLSHEGQSRRFFGWNTIADERKLDRGQNRKQKRIRGEGEELTLLAPARESRNASNNSH